MNDPHVVALIYRVKHGDTFNYDNTAPLYLKNQNVNDCWFDLIVEDKEVQFKFKTPYATKSEARAARAAIEEYIQNWEFDACLERNNPDYFRLEFDKSVTEDRNPTPGVHKVNAGTIKWNFDLSSPSVTHSPASYPLPPSDIKLDADTETMFQRYMGYCRDREKLPSMAYLCLTVLENSAKPPSPQGKRPTSKKRLAAVGKYQIEEDVLNEIGRLSTEKGGDEGRKGEALAKNLTHEERHFMEQAVKKMIRRMAEKAHDPNKTLQAISLSGFPRI